MRVWPERSGDAPAPEQASIQPVEYHEPTTAGLAERCATAAAEWGTDKVASVVDRSALYKDPDAHPLVLMLMVLDRYPECLEWDPEVLRATMFKDNLQVSGACWDKIKAVMVLLVSPSVWRQWHVFHWVARALGGKPPNFVYLEQPELGHLVVCADIMKIVDPSRKTAEEVDKYIAAAFKADGHVFIPPPLQFAQRELEDPQLECSSCGAMFRDDNDAKCVSCGAASLRKVPFDYAALRDQCAALWAPRQSLVIEQAVVGLPDGAPGSLVEVLLLHWDYARKVRQQLLAQLRVVAK